MTRACSRRPGLMPARQRVGHAIKWIVTERIATELWLLPPPIDIRGRSTA